MRMIEQDEIADEPNDESPTEQLPPRSSWFNRNRGVVVAAALILVAIGGIGLGSILGNSGEGGDSDDSASVYVDDYSEETTTTIDACHDKAASIIGDLDNGASSVQVYADYGGVQDPETQAFIQLYYRFQAQAVQVGSDTAMDDLVDAIDAACS